MANGGTVYDYQEVKLQGHRVSRERSYVIVPSDVKLDDLQPVPDLLRHLPVITEWWIELCLFDSQIHDTNSPFTRPFYRGSINGMP